jgi:hypothetical protein
MVSYVPDWRGVVSSNIAAVAHDPRSNDLWVRFKPGKDGGDGPVWIYSGVPAGKFAGLMSAESVGKFHHAEIRGKHEARPHPATRAARGEAA